MQAKFSSVDKLEISMDTTTAQSQGRQYGSVFGYNMFAGNPITTSAPSVVAQTTNDTVQVITGTVGDTVLGSAEAFSVTVNGKTYNKGDPALVISGQQWTLNIPNADALRQGGYDVRAVRNLLADQTKTELVVDIDTDGDGILNIQDLDNDNDGILDIKEKPYPL